MIVLDEHLREVAVQDAVRQWYRGNVCMITDLRPGTLIKDDGIASLLQTADHPTFITLNWSDFWQHIAAHPDYCVVCLTLLPDRSAEISSLLRRLFRLPAFKTKASRMGKVARISGGQVIYYQPHDSATFVLPLP